VRHIPFVLAICLVLAACEETKSVQYYEDNPNDRAAKMEECQNNPGEKEYMPNCENAKTALKKKLLDPNNKGVSKIDWGKVMEEVNGN
jgi:hypothetical protein